MNADAGHPPLRRVSRGPRVPVNTSDQPAQRIFPLLSYCNSGPADSAATTAAVVARLGGWSVSEPRLADSCYGSSSDSDHSCLSREASGSHYADSESADALPVSSSQDRCSQLEALRRFVVKLGYKEAQLEDVLRKLGTSPMPEQDMVLAELVQLGKEGAPLGFAVANSRRSAPFVEDRRLRAIVVDGSNLAMTHGRKEVFSCAGIWLCVQWFVNCGHTDVTVFVPQFRREAPRGDSPMSDQQLLFELEAAGHLVWTPSRWIGGRRVVCYDDRYVLKTAVEKDAVIVSNDEYRDLVRENGAFRRVVEERLLMYSFVDGRFMPPDDPLGKRGPRLDQFLSKGGVPASAALCPYGPKCTYGNKCKYYHPERPGGIHIGVAERIMRQTGKKSCVSATPSLGLPVEKTSAAGVTDCKPTVARTYSLNLPMASSTSLTPMGLDLPTSVTLVVTSSDQLGTMTAVTASDAYGAARRTQLSKQSSNPESARVSVQQLAPPPLTPSYLSVASSVLSAAAYDAACSHQAVNRNCSAPGAYATGRQMTQGEVEAAALWRAESSDSAIGSESSANLYVPSTTVWGPLEFSVGPVTTAVPPPQPPASAERDKLAYHLSQLFPASIVSAVMASKPDEADPRVLCARILAIQREFAAL